MRFDLSDDEWALLEPLMPKSRKSSLQSLVSTRPYVRKRR